MKSSKEYENLYDRFVDPDPGYRLTVYFDAKRTDAADDAVNFVNSCEQRDVGRIIPRISDDRLLDPGEAEHFLDTYRAMLSAAKEKGIKLAFNLEGAIEDALISEEDEVYGDSFMRSKVLVRHDYFCSPEEKLNLPLHEGDLMSLVAVGERFGDTVDLRPFVKEGHLRWQVPDGNWKISEFICAGEYSRNFVNVLNYRSFYRYLEEAYALFADIFEPYVPDVLDALAYSDLCFPSENRRDWDPSFNEVFEKLYGFDPSPFYPALFAFDRSDAPNLKALFFNCRAKMFAEGAVKALNDFAAAHGLIPLGSIAEPKLSACSFITGDALLDSRYAPGALYDKAYMYGTNSVKIAAAAAYNFGVDTVSCEMFRDYFKISKKIICNDALNAFARGANLLMAHMPDLPEDHMNPVPFVKSEKAPDWQDRFACFVSRTQALLRGGSHIADIGLLYPIYAIHSGVNLYTARVDRFEYPDTPADTDYMTIINGVTMYSGHDLTVIHPEVMNSSCRVESGKLILDNGVNRETLQVMILPCSATVSIGNMRLLRDFFRSGGKLIATGALPCRAFEYNPDGSLDREITGICREIFGDEAVDPDIIKSYCYNKNDAGGEAYFLYFTRTAADGTNMTSSHKITDAICSFEIPYDMYLPNMPRLEGTGALNTPYFEFVKLGLIYSIPGGGMLNHIHKRHGSTDVYYFSNTTDKNYDKFVLLRGALKPEIWDPHRVTVETPDYKYVRWRGEIYTRVSLNLRNSASVFIISDSSGVRPDLTAARELFDVPGLD